MESALLPTPSAHTFSSNLFKHLFNIAANQSGMQLYIGEFTSTYNAITAKIGALLFKLFHIPVDAGTRGPHYTFAFDNLKNKFSLWEDIALFGSVGMIMILLTVYILATFLLKLFTKKYLIFAFLFMGYLSAMSYLIRYGHWENRFMITAMLIGSPALALIFDTKNRVADRLGTVIILYSIMILIPATFMNEQKLLKHFFCYNTNIKRHVININLRNGPKLRCRTRPTMCNIILQFNSLVPLNSKVGILLPRDSWDYPLFGDGLKRKIVPLNLEILQEQKFDFLLIVDKELTWERHKDIRELIEKKYRVKMELGEEKREDTFGTWVLYEPIANNTVS
jgi:hypothetical protein